VLKNGDLGREILPKKNAKYFAFFLGKIYLPIYRVLLFNIGQSCLTMKEEEQNEKVSFHSSINPGNAIQPIRRKKRRGCADFKGYANQRWDYPLNIHPIPKEEL
jgi:hypothetical protein